MIYFVLGVGIEMREIIEFKIFTFEEYTWNFALIFIFTHEFEENGSIAMKDGVNIFGSFQGDTSEISMIIVFAPKRTKETIASSVYLISTYFAFSHTIASLFMGAG